MIFFSKCLRHFNFSFNAYYSIGLFPLAAVHGRSGKALGQNRYSLLKNIEQTMPGVARVMAKGYYTHYLSPRFSLSTLVKHVGARKAHKDFSRSDLKSYTTVDATVNVMAWHGWNVHASVKNIFNADVRYPSLYNQHKNGLPRERINYLFTCDRGF